MTNPDSSAQPTQTLTAQDIEAAYERALQAMDAVEVAVAHLSTSATGEAVSTTDDADDEPDVIFDRDIGPRSGPGEEPVDPQTAPMLHPREVIEAALFVGGQSLTTKRLSQMLGGSETPEHIDRHIEELNSLYRSEARPYQIDFGEGGYRLVLHPEFEPVRNAVFGAGPKDVKLSQEALEVLAFVAYRQPTTSDELEAAGRQRADSLLRQLLRRELITLDRDEEGVVKYSTSPRFLDVFGLRSLDDLPFPEDLELK